MAACRYEIYLLMFKKYFTRSHTFQDLKRNFVSLHASVISSINFVECR